MSAAVSPSPAPAARNTGPFSLRTVLVLVLVGVFSFSALAVLSAYAPELRSGDDGAGHALSRSAVGFAGAVRLFNETGRRTAMSRGPLGQEDADSLLVLTPGAQHDAEAVAEVAHQGTRLVVLPKWAAFGDPQRRGWVRSAGVIPPSRVAAILPGEGKTRPLIARREGAVRPRLSRPDGETIGGTLGEIRQLQTISGPGWIPVLVDETGAAVLAMHAESGVYVLAEPDLLNTHGISDLATAATAVRIPSLIWRGEGPILFDLTLHGLQRQRSVLRLALEPPLLGATLCLLAAALLTAFQAGVRFGGPRAAGRVFAHGKRALADNTAGLVRLARREHRMAAPYALLIRAAVARAVAAPRNLSSEELEAFLDRLAESMGTQDRYAALAGQARSARTARDLMRVARNLYRWRLEMTRGRQ